MKIAIIYETWVCLQFDNPKRKRQEEDKAADEVVRRKPQDAGTEVRWQECIEVNESLMRNTSRRGSS